MDGFSAPHGSLDGEPSSGYDSSEHYQTQANGDGPATGFRWEQHPPEP